MLEAVPAAAIRALAVAAQVGGAVVGGDVVLAGNVENTIRTQSAEHLRGGVELVGLGELRDVSRVENERGTLRQRVDLGDGLLQGCRDVLVGLLAEADVAVAHLDEEDALPLSGREQRESAQSKGLGNAAGQPPNGCRACPRHAPEKAASVDAVVARVGGDVIAPGGPRVSLLVEPVVVTV